jgi:hypothetical protein
MRIQSYKTRYKKLQGILEELKGISSSRKGPSGELGKFVDLLDECLNSEGDRIISEWEHDGMQGLLATSVHPRLYGRCVTMLRISQLAMRLCAWAGGDFNTT